MSSEKYLAFKSLGNPEKFLYEHHSEIITIPGGNEIIYSKPKKEFKFVKRIAIGDCRITVRYLENGSFSIGSRGCKIEIPNSSNKVITSFQDRDFIDYLIEIGIVTSRVELSTSRQTYEIELVDFIKLDLSEVPQQVRKWFEKN